MGYPGLDGIMNNRTPEQDDVVYYVISKIFIGKIVGINPDILKDEIKTSLIVNSFISKLNEDFIVNTGKLKEACGNFSKYVLNILSGDVDFYTPEIMYATKIRDAVSDSNNEDFVKMLTLHMRAYVLNFINTNQYHFNAL